MTKSREKLLFATRSRGKLVELRPLLEQSCPGLYELLSLDDLDDPPPDVEQTGKTFAQIAERKARETMAATGLPCIADHSGLEVDALRGRPGVRSARWAPTVQQRIDRLLNEMRGVPAEERTGRFRCAVAYVDPTRPDQVLLRAGSCEGVILEAPRGEQGFGYDPLFFVEELGKTFAEASAEEKNRLSHRGRAMRELASALQALRL